MSTTIEPNNSQPGSAGSHAAPGRDVLVANIGNTHTTVAPAAGGQLTGPAESFATEELLNGPIPERLRTPQTLLWAASVVPLLASRLQRIRPLGSLRLLTVDDAPGVDFSDVDTRTLGADRIANAVEAAAICTPPILILDAGTAVTLEIVDADRRFRGGFIAPGRALQRLALRNGTAQLPDVPIGDNAPVFPGTDTASAIAAGIDLGLVGTVLHLIALARQALDSPECPVLTTGRDAEYLHSSVPELVIAPPDLALRGLARIAKESE